MDNLNGACCHDAVRNLEHDKTIIRLPIGFRLHKDCDTIFLMENGHLSPKEVMTNSLKKVMFFRSMVSVLIAIAYLGQSATPLALQASSGCRGSSIAHTPGASHHPQAIAIDEDYATQYPPVIDPRLQWLLESRPQPRHLRVRSGRKAYSSFSLLRKAEGCCKGKINGPDPMASSAGHGSRVLTFLVSGALRAQRASDPSSRHIRFSWVAHKHRPQYVGKFSA